ncbi:hypothetical protein AmaxDRAFT_4409 [Limnospira maxima CS-328]|uniref:Uncharacterized protein n=1 Tax=Limnospira maxima CS-328 TaxID=513049 RepID=B5W6L0_LIMMA|nr:hypothetical protein AmaxDRAFT_4409 [Limnospira maxima CS-328]RAQ39870.1 hypothetical protein B9S53_19160 [Arthrospira sp. O9.13F]UWU45617.1 hypothetical protein APLC1_0298 [Arthrospira platensis C1]
MSEKLLWPGWKVENQLDTPRSEETGILGSPRPLKLDSLRRLAQRWDSPQALLSVCPTVVAFLPILFRLKQIYLKN